MDTTFVRRMGLVLDVGKMSACSWKHGFVGGDAVIDWKVLVAMACKDRRKSHY